MRLRISLARLRLRLLVSATAGIALFAVLPSAWSATTRALVAWDAGAGLYLGLAWVMMARSTMQEMHDRAAEEDEGAIAVLVLTMAAAVMSLGAIAAELAGIRGPGAPGQTLRLVLAAFTILCSWFFVNTIFAIHYAHEYYGERGKRRGLSFPAESAPDYWDFLYFSFTIGAAAQTSDVTITSKSMRRLVLAHTVLGFLFNTTVLALAINVGASLL